MHFNIQIRKKKNLEKKFNLKILLFAKKMKMEISLKDHAGIIFQ